MKQSNLILSSLLLCILLMVFESCKKDNDSSPNSTSVSTTSTFKAKVNGKDFYYRYSNASFYYLYDTIPVILLQTVDTLNNEIFIAFYDLNHRILQLKTYYAKDEADFAYFQDGLSSYSLKEGQVTLTKLDTTNKKISGIFSFLLIANNGSDSTITVTDGKFTNFKYENIQ